VPLFESFESFRPASSEPIHRFALPSRVFQISLPFDEQLQEIEASIEHHEGLKHDAC
jgi:hypothetical protein